MTIKLEANEIKYLISRKKATIALIDRREYHMAVCKILADISSLKGLLEQEKDND